MNNRIDITGRVMSMLELWADWAGRYCFKDFRDSALHCFGPGYVSWGVQSNWNYIATMATLSVRTDNAGNAVRRRERALGALRFALTTHVSGSRAGNDGKTWGHSWIAMLGIERAMHGLACIREALTPEDQTSLRRVLLSEADWLLHGAGRNGRTGVGAGKWAADHCNVPESNIWSGCFLWRVAHLYPEEPDAPAWIELAHRYLLNGVSMDADAGDDTPVAGKPLRERHAGANFFPHYALDHHGYLNIGYMAICMSNAAILHFDLKRDGLKRPDSLDHHQLDLWKVLRRMIFPDGRLARIGGDSRVRYAYCQEYLLPALLYAADRLKDPHASGLADRQVACMEHEAAAAGDGSFYGGRLTFLRDSNPHYYTRLESDRACVLAMLLNYLPLVEVPPASPDEFESSVAGGWVEPEHGAVLTRSPGRFASFSWRAFGLGQALCVPPGEGSLTEWLLNLSPVVCFLDDDGTSRPLHRRLIRNHIHHFEGGFTTSGSIMEGVDVPIDEGAAGTDQAVTHLAFAALPDGHTCVGLQYVINAPDRVGFLAQFKGLHLNVPNDVFNDCRRIIRSVSGETELTAPAARDERITCTGNWLNIDGVLGIVVLYGADGFCIDRSAERRGGRYKSLYVEKVCTQVSSDLQRILPGTVLTDIGYAVLSSTDAATTAMFRGERLNLAGEHLRGMRVAALDGKTYIFIANFGLENASTVVAGKTLRIPAGESVLELCG